MSFGLSLAPEELQRRINKAIARIIGVTEIADDVLVYDYGETLSEARQDHNRNLLGLLGKSPEIGIKWHFQRLYCWMA